MRDGSRGQRGSRGSRWWGLAGFSARRVLTRITHTERQQTLLTIGGVALAIGLLLVVTSVGLGMLAQSTVASETTDSWIVPEGAATSAVTDVQSQRLGDVHATTDRIERLEGVTYATPILLAVLRADSSAATDVSYLVVVGVIPSPDQESLVGLPTTRLTTGDPYYANGTYNGTWTGEAVLSRGAAGALGVSRGGSFTVGESGPNTPRHTFTAVEVGTTRAAGIGQMPVALVHLSELQGLIGAGSADGADQILVTGGGTAVKSKLKGIYPGTDVVNRRGLLLHQSQERQLPVAISLAALVIAVVVGTLFVTTTMGMEIAAGSRQRAVLSAVGFSPGSRAVVVALQALVVALLGGVAGVALAGVGVLLTNALSTTFLSRVPIAAFRPLFVVYGLGVAFLIGLLSLPYLLVVEWRSTTTVSVLR